MQPPEVSSGLFDTLPSPIGPGWRLRVLVAGTNFVERAVPIVARVGDVPVEGISLSGGGRGLIGFLAQTPADGAKLWIGYADSELVETGVAYQTPAVA
jgi:hypothetical protein